MSELDDWDIVAVSHSCTGDWDALPKLTSTWVDDTAASAEIDAQVRTAEQPLYELDLSTLERLDPDVVIRDRGQRLEGAATQGRAGQVGPVVTGGGLEPGRQTHRLGGRGHPLMVGESPLRVGGPVTHDRAADGTGVPARMVP